MYVTPGYGKSSLTIAFIGTMGFGNEIWHILNYMGYLDMLSGAPALSPDTAQLIKEQWYLPLEGIGCTWMVGYSMFAYVLSFRLIIQT